MNASTRRHTPTKAKTAAIYDTSEGCTRTTMQHHRAAVRLAAWQSIRPDAKLADTSPHATMQHGNGHMQGTVHAKEGLQDVLPAPCRTIHVPTPSRTHVLTVRAIRPQPPPAPLPLLLPALHAALLTAVGLRQLPRLLPAAAAAPRCLQCAGAGAAAAHCAAAGSPPSP